MARRSTRPEEQPEGEDNAEYVECPACHGAGRGCKYCVGHGDVHPEDVDAILDTIQSDKNKKLYIGIGAGVLGVLLLVAIIMIVKSGGSGPDGQGNTGGKKAGSSSAPPASVNFGNSAPPAGYSKDARQMQLDMKFELQCTNYAKVIEIGNQALPLTQDEIQKKNIQSLMDQAKAKMGTK